MALADISNGNISPSSYPMNKSSKNKRAKHSSKFSLSSISNVCSTLNFNLDETGGKGLDARTRVLQDDVLYAMDSIAYEHAIDFTLDEIGGKGPDSINSTKRETGRVENSWIRLSEGRNHVNTNEPTRIDPVADEILQDDALDDIGSIASEDGEASIGIRTDHDDYWDIGDPAWECQ